jgi:epoxyqueuosine reductase
MQTLTSDRAADLAVRLKTRALAEGFDAMRIARPDAIQQAPARLAAFIAEGCHGTMDWLARDPGRRADPRRFWPEARSVVMLGLSYHEGRDALARLDNRTKGVISLYALGRDYHDVIKAKLKRVAGWLAAETGAPVKVFVDTAALMEKPLAAAAGLGWQGKHTNLVSRDLGSWFFLGCILSAVELPANQPGSDACGSCQACLDICPTKAIPAPYRLDARRCISYLTIEHKGPIAHEFRPAMGNRIYGCDDCLAVCPWNKFAVHAREASLRAMAHRVDPPLAELAELDDPGFRGFFSGSPVKRTGRDRFVRNVMIAIGNSGTEKLAAAAEARLADGAAIVRGAAVWALSRLLDRPAFQRLRATWLPREKDADVVSEWTMG